MTVGSLFSGIGGLDLGLERAGFDIAWQCEVDPYCRRVLAQHWPGVPIFGDIRTLKEAPPVDVLAGGFPCQPVSLAGKRNAQADSRWLWPEFARLIGALRPRYVVAENVRGLRTAGLRDVLADLARLRYDAEWQVISAAAVGAPHIRERYWIVAYPHSTRLQGVYEPRGGDDLQQAASTLWGNWPPEPALARVDYGVPRRVVQPEIQALGNAVVPRCAELVGTLIQEHWRLCSDQRDQPGWIHC